MIILVINHASRSVASQQFFTGTMETMRGFVFAGGGGGRVPLLEISTTLLDHPHPAHEHEHVSLLVKRGLLSFVDIHELVAKRAEEEI